MDRVEREDEAVIELVQKGVRSRLYDRGRYSPTRETGTHHFHRLLVEFLTADAVAESDCYGTFCIGLADDILIQLFDDLARRKIVQFRPRDGFFCFSP